MSAPTDPQPNTNPDAFPLKQLSPKALTQLKEDLTAMRAQMDCIREYNQILGQVKHDKYEAYLEAGFTKEQALELVKAGGASLF